MRRWYLMLACVLVSTLAIAQQRDEKKAIWADMDGITVPLPPKEHPT